MKAILCGTAFLLAAALCGCAGTVSAPVSTPPVSAPIVYTGVAFTASVFAGSSAISGASLTLLAAGTSGNGSAATSLISSVITTDSTGTASIPASYNCPTANSLVYLVARGGVVAGTGTTRSQAALITPVGACGSITSASKFKLNEVTTVATIFALQQFYSVGGNLGSSSTNAAGLMNAVATAATLSDPVTGLAPGPTLPANVTAPTRQVNSLANLVNACLVSTTACNAFFAAVASNGSSPVNTLDALYDLAGSPATSVAPLFTQSQASSAYAPALAVAPTDWTLFLTVSGGGLNSPSALGVDSSGAVWVANYFSVASKFTPVGAPAFASGITGAGLNHSYGLAIDAADNVWIPNELPVTSTGIGSVSELSSAGTPLAGNGFTSGGLDYPLSVAIDPNGTVWVVDFGNSHLTLLNAAGAPLSGSAGYTSPTIAFPDVVAVDKNHFGWVGNLFDTRVTKVAPDGSSFTVYNCCDGAAGIAFDQQNNAWIANFYGNSVSMISNSGTVVSNGAYTGLNSLIAPQGIAVDGAGNVWVANYHAAYLTELAGATASVPGSSLSPGAGFGADAKLLEAFALAIDASGNVWVSNQGSSTVTKFIGLAAPVKTPVGGIAAQP